MSSRACSPDLLLSVASSFCLTLPRGRRRASQVCGGDGAASHTHIAAWLCRFWADMYLAQYYDEPVSASAHPTITIDSGYMLASQGAQNYNPVGTTGLSKTHHFE